MANLVECKTRGYFTNQQSIGFQLTAVPLEGDINGEMKITFYNPWLLFGFALLSDTNSVPTLPQTEITVAPDAEQLNWIDLPPLLTIMLMFANQQDPDPLLPQEYTSGLFWKYFSRYMNPGLFPMNYNTFMFPLWQPKQFWIDENAVPNPYREQAIYTFVKSLCDISDKRLWGAPGTYTIRSQNGIFNAWTGCFQGEGPIGTNRRTVLNFENPVNIVLGPSTLAYIAIAPGLNPTPVVWGSYTVPYAGVGPAAPDWASFPNTPAGVAAAIAAWIQAVLIAETGDPGEPVTNYPAIATWGADVSANAIDILCSLTITPGIQVTVASDDGYTWGALGLPAGPNRLWVNFRNAYPQQPYWTALENYVATNGKMPVFATIEQKSIE